MHAQNKYLKISILIFEVLYLRKGNRCLHAICHDSITIHSLSVYQMFNGQLAKLPTILQRLFTGVANITSNPIEVGDGGGREPQSGKQRLH